MIRKFIYVNLLLLSGCGLWGGQERPTDPFSPRQLIPLTVHKVILDEECIGLLRFLKIPDTERDRRVYLVENRYKQWIGWIDTTGRAFRCRPHQKEPDHVYTGDTATCIQVLMGLDRRPFLEKVE